MSGRGEHSGADDLVRPGRRSARGGPVRLLLVMVCTAVVVLVATLAASSGPTEVFAGSGPDPERVRAAPPAITPTPSPAPLEDDTDGATLPSDPRDSLRALGAFVRAALLVLIVVSVVLAVVVHLRRRRPRRGASGLVTDREVDFELVDPVAAVSAALAADAGEQDAALLAGSPRNGIVEAWRRFELQAARAGTPRQEWETSTEFTLRLLDSVGADPEATSRLAELYRLARFSDHEVGETEREAAAAALDRIRGRLAPQGGRSR